MAYVRKTLDVWEIHGNFGYGDGWEVITTETDRQKAIKNYKLYVENDITGMFKLVKKRVPKQ